MATRQKRKSKAPPRRAKRSLLASRPAVPWVAMEPHQVDIAGLALIKGAGAQVRAKRGMLDHDHDVRAVLPELRRQRRNSWRAREQRVHLAAAARIRERACRAHRLERNAPQRAGA